MHPAILHKVQSGLPPPNLGDYAEARRSFTWEKARRELGESPSGEYNLASLAVDRHAMGEKADHIAFRWMSRSGLKQEVSYRELQGLSNRFAHVLQSLGINKGDRIFSLCGRIPELYVAALGTLKKGAVFCPLFSAFGPEPILTRLLRGEGSTLVTTDTLYRKKIAGIRDQLPALKHVLLVRESPGEGPIPGTHDLAALTTAASPEFETVRTDAEDAALLHFTSGTTGTPKGALHVHGAALMHYVTGKYALDLHPEDLFWCTADPGWVTGTSYGIFAPLLHGVTSVVDEADFDAERWYGILQNEKVTVWYTAPTAIRMLMKAGAETASKYRFPELRFVASVGEPLNPEAVWWGKEALGLPIHDNWWQTETGGILIANFPVLDIKPGSMGKPLPGIEACIVQKAPDGSARVIEEPNQEGELAIKRGWPSQFRGYLHEEERFRKCFSDDLYLTGDLAKRDEDGYFWFVGRSDDVIKSAGHLIGPFEVESALLEHAAVAEAGVIGIPDPVVGEVVQAYVSLRTGFAASDSLRKEIQGFARKRLGAVVAPKEIQFVPALPRTRSGKIMRRLLKARALGLPEGDLSTLETAP